MRKHILRVVVILCFTLAVLIAIFGWISFFEGTVDIQLHDTYFVTASYGPFILLFSIFGFVSYFSSESVRMFKDRQGNLFLLGFTILLFLSTFQIYNLGGSFLEGMSEWQVYPPGGKFKNELMRRYRQWNIISWAIKIFLIVLSLVLIYRSFFDKKTGSRNNPFG